MMKRVESFILAMLLGVFLLMGCERSRDPQPHSMPEPPPLQQGREYLDRLRGLEHRALGLCILGRQSEALFPDLAAKFYKDALTAVEKTGNPDAFDKAADLRAICRDPSFSRYKYEAADLAANLEDKAHSAWLARMVAQGAAGLDQGLAQQAMQLGLQRAGGNPDIKAREWDTAGLVMVMSRWAPKRAMLVAQGIQDAWVRTWVWRRLAGQFRQPDLLETASRESADIKDRAVRAMVLARIAGQSIRMGAPNGQAIFGEALKQAAGLDDPRRTHMLQGECAAQIIGKAHSGLVDWIWQVPSGGGARFKALNLAIPGLLVRHPERGKQLWQAGLREAMDIELDAERARAVSSLVYSMAALSPAEARRALQSGPEGDMVLRSEAAGFLILAEAGRDMAGALAQIEDIEDLSLRIGSMARLADILRRDEPKLARGVYARILELAKKLGLDLVPAPILARAAAETGPTGAIKLAGRIILPLHRADYLFNLAKILMKKNRHLEGRKYLEICLTTIKYAATKLILDKVRLLGDMGRGWVEIDEAQARLMFEQAADLTL